MPLLIAVTKTKVKMKKKREILMPHGGKKKLKESTGYSEVTVKFALRGVIDGKAADLIRKRALELGGVMGRE